MSAHGIQTQACPAAALFPITATTVAVLMGGAGAKCRTATSLYDPSHEDVALPSAQTLSE